MVNLSKIDTKEFLSVVFKHEELRDKLYDCIHDSEFYYLNDKLDCFSFSCADWSIGTYNSNFLRVRGSSEFIPTSGFQLDHTVCAHTFWGFIWSSTLNTKHPHLVSYLKFYSDDCCVSSTCRSAGFPIRPVSK